jgi:hypothetical protein
MQSDSMFERVSMPQYHGTQSQRHSTMALSLNAATAHWNSLGSICLIIIETGFQTLQTMQCAIGS